MVSGDLPWAIQCARVSLSVFEECQVTISTGLSVKQCLAVSCVRACVPSGSRALQDERLRALFSFQTLYAARNTVAVAVAVGPWVDPSSPGGSAGGRGHETSMIRR